MNPVLKDKDMLQYHTNNISEYFMKSMYVEVPGMLKPVNSLRRRKKTNQNPKLTNGVSNTYMTSSKSKISKLNFDSNILPERTTIPRKMTCCNLLLMFITERGGI